jgi:hypothetical protein
MEIVLNRRIASRYPRRFEFVETAPGQPEVEPGFKEFLNDASLSGTAIREEIELLRKLRFNGKRPTSTFLLPRIAKPQRPAAFSSAHEANSADENAGPVPAQGSVAPTQKYREADGIEKQLQLNDRRAKQRWAGNTDKRVKNQKPKS